ncbi:hypothetical protein [Flavobacterium terrisoli]|uniref:hypothetical protein n=1 Tax=Flavobacterium terrisoli TaxID=3242195 RepID=UPI00254390CA|nr:hypothetical protein [Flavobacterium buctense]
MKIKLLIILTFFQSFGFCQSTELTFLRGRIICPIKELGEVNIFNLRSESGTTSNNSGSYTMFVKAGDTLQFQSLQIETKKVVIRQEDLAKSILVTTLVPKTINLEEVEIKDNSNINAVSLGILPKPAKKYTPAERRLQTASEVDFTPSVGLMAGGSFGVDPIINAITGRTAMLKKELEVERKERLMTRIESQFKPDYFTKKLKIPEENVKGFLYYIVEDAKLTNYIKAKNKGMAKFRMSELATQYLAMQKMDKK